MLIARKAMMEDYPAMAAMAQRFAASDPRGFKVSPDDFQNMFATTFMRDELAMWLTVQSGEPVGMMCGFAYPSLFNSQEGVAQELFLWVEEAYRGTDARKKMLEKFEEWAGGRRKLLTMPAGDRDEAVVRMMRGAGYAPLENTFYKD